MQDATTRSCAECGREIRSVGATTVACASCGLIQRAVAPQSRPEPRGWYQQRLAEIVPPNVQPRHVEAYMRLAYGTLDGLSAELFRVEADLCTGLVLTDPEGAEQLARSYGL